MILFTVAAYEGNNIALFNYPVEYKNKFKKREMITWLLSEFSIPKIYHYF